MTNPLPTLINDSLQKFEACVGTKIRDDGVHIDFICKSCGQQWGEEEKAPRCSSFFNAQMDKRIIQSNLSVIQAMKEKVNEMMGEHTDACGDSPLKECNPNCPQKYLSTLSNWLQEAEDLISNKK